MEKIGKLLKEQRLKLGLTIEDIATKTRLSSTHIKALEDGNLEYFREDLSYVRFFIRSYCGALGIDYNDIKNDVLDSVDSYTSAYEKKALDDHIKSEENIAKQSKRMKSTKEKDTNGSKKYMAFIKNMKTKGEKVDIAMVMLIALVIVIIGALAYVFINRSGSENEVNQKDVPVVEPVQNKEDEKPKEEQAKKEEENTKNIAIKNTEGSQTEFIVTNTKKEELEVQITFTNDCWFEANIDGQVLSEPASAVYKNRTVSFKVPYKEAGKFNLRFGAMGNVSEITINGTKVEVAKKLPSPNILSFIIRRSE